MLKYKPYKLEKCEKPKKIIYSIYMIKDTKIKNKNYQIKLLMLENKKIK